MSVVLEQTEQQAPEVTTEDVCQRAAYLIEEFGHCKHAWARRSDGIGTSFMDNEAASFCLIGALWRASYELKMYTYDLGLDFQWLRKWNDQARRTKEDVISYLQHMAAGE